VSIPFQRVLITGGAGFVGSNLALMLHEHDPAVTALDDLERRGSERSLGPLRATGVRFAHADTRWANNLEALPDFDLLIDCAAEPRTHDLDVRFLITDNSRVEQTYGWRPPHGVERTLADIREWIDANAEALRPVLA
jgi:nucleoside-diphosphate-sugar epimerase